MKRLVLVLFLSALAIILMAQKKYICEFTDTMTTVLPDSVFAHMLTSSRPDIEIPPEAMQQFLSQIKLKPLSLIQNRIVKAEIEKTIITMDRSSKSGNLTVETFDSILYKNDEIFMDSASKSGFSVQPIIRAKKEFLATGKEVSILNYLCDEYLSTDSTCYIWVTKDLPEYINPGIRKGNIKGAVLGFELKGEPYTTKSVLSKLGRGL